MILIFGGAYQGKLDFTEKTFDIKEDEVFLCTEDSNLDFSKKVFCNTENFVLKCVRDGAEAREYLSSHLDILKDKIFIINDISQGIVPMEPDLREWREMVGRTMVYLSKEAEAVYRVFCGIGQRIK